MDISKWAFRNRNLIYFLIAVLLFGGAYSCYQMSKLEDPEIKVKLAMVVTTYPGASAHQVELEVTDVLEKNIRTMGNIDNIESYSYNNLSLIQIELLSTVPDDEVEQCWDMLRRKVSDAHALLPEGATTPIVKDDFGNVYGMFYALTGDGLSDRELSDYAELVKREVNELEGVDRVELYGKRSECINISLLQDLQSDRCKVEMISGCNDPTCHKRRFKTQLIALGMQQFDRVILEPSGIFDMDEFFDTLYESPLDRWFSIGSILTIVDATMDEVLSAQMEYLLASEAACCGKLVLSKRSLLPDCSEAALTDRTLRHLNRSLAAIQCSRQFQPQDLFLKDWDSMTDADFQELQAAGYRNSSYVKQYDADDIQSHSEVHYFMHIHLPDERIPEILQAMLNDPNCGTIYRIKGALPLKQNCWLSINLTQKKAELQTVSNGQSVLIVIGDQLNRAALDAHLKAENTDPDYVSI